MPGETSASFSASQSSLPSSRMDFLSDLRDFRGLPAKIITLLVGLFLFALVVAMVVSGFLYYRVVSPPQTGAVLDPAILIGGPTVETFSVPGGKSLQGWFFPRLKTAPTIILCHGYQSNRGELLTLVSALQEHGYNVFVFDFSSHGSAGGFSSLGFHETQQVLAAIEAVARRDDVDRTRFGLWGASLGAYAALAAAASDSRVRAVIADSAYDEPAAMFRLQVERSGLGGAPLVGRFAMWAYKLLHLSYRTQPPLSQRLPGLAGVPKLFIQAHDNPELAEATKQLFLQAPEPREQLLLAKSNYARMFEEERRAYEASVVRFFLQNIPPAGPPAVTPVPRR